MKRILVGVMAAMLAAGASNSEAERQLKAAMNAELVNGDLKAAIKQYGEIAAKYKNAALGEIDTVRKIRSIFHKSGLDPTRYRPSSESLLRRAVKGKGLYLINSVVDLINYFSLRTLCPMGLYNADRLVPPIEWRIGAEGETYEGIGRDWLNLAHFPLLSDTNGPFGSPISDSMKTKVTEDCTHILWITFAPAGTAVPLQEFADTTAHFCGGEVVTSQQVDV